MAGNPARIIRKIKTRMDPDFTPDEAKSDIEGAEVPMARLAVDIERRVQES